MTPSAAPLLVLDSSVVLHACIAGELRLVADWRLLAPPLLWSEVTSALHEAQWRQDLTAPEASRARETFRTFPLHRDDPSDLRATAWDIADELGLAKTYDAEFLALARIRGCLLVTADARLRRAASRLGYVVDPVEVEQRHPL